MTQCVFVHGFPSLASNFNKNWGDKVTNPLRTIMVDPCNMLGSTSLYMTEQGDGGGGETALMAEN